VNISYSIKKSCNSYPSSQKFLTFAVMQNRKNDIRRTAARLFRKKGYGATSMRNIADGVGIQAASIYNHFKSKQILLQDLLMLPAMLYTKEMQAVKNSTLSPREKIEKLIRHHVRMAVEHTDSVALIVADWAHLEGDVRTHFFQLREDYEADFKEIIEIGKTNGAFNPNINTDVAVFSILSTLRWLFSWYNRNKSFDVEELEEQMMRVLLHGLLV
jgi:AcrR family transcriptional regulator